MKVQRAKFREMQLDTHKILPPEDHPKHGAPKSPAAASQQQIGSTAAGATGAAKPSGALQKQALQQADGTCRSTFKARPEHAHAIALANQHKQLVERSGWAQLNKLDSALERAEAAQRLKLKHDMQGGRAAWRPAVAAGLAWPGPGSSRR
jgi:hypothetical protein